MEIVLQVEAFIVFLSPEDTQDVLKHTSLCLQDNSPG